VAVQKNPYQRWAEVRRDSDYRSRETQASSLTRQMLSNPEYLRNRNRVNPGPVRNLRALAADSADQVPHGTCNEDIWGWQRWTEAGEYLIPTDLATNLLERANTNEIPGCGES
jgi:hypothetical protein